MHHDRRLVPAAPGAAARAPCTAAGGRRRLIYDRRRSNAPTPMPFAKVQMPLSPVPADDPRRQWNCRRDAQPTSPLEGLEGMHVFG